MSNSLKDLKARFAAVNKALGEIESALKSGIKGQPAAAQIARMIAYGAHREASKLIDEGKNALTVLKQNEPSNDVPNPPIVAAPVVAKALAEQFGMEPEAAGPFMGEMSEVMLDAIEGLVKVAQDKLAEAEKAQA